MKKICLIGKLNAIGSNIYDMLTEKYQVQLCGKNAEMIDGVLHLMVPDLILVCTSDMDASNQDIFDVLQNVHLDVPAICVGSAEELSYFNEYVSEERMQILVRPVTNREIRKKVDELLDVSVLSKESVLMQRALDDKPNTVNGEETVKKRIQIIDDSMIQLRMMQGLLSRQYEVHIASSAEEGMKQMKKRKPDLIFLDYDMPVCDGRETFNRLKQDEELRDIPVVFLTGVNDKQRIQAVLAMNPAGYLLKPISKNKLLEMASGTLCQCLTKNI